MTVAARAIAERKTFGHLSVVSGCHASPVLQSAEHGLDAIASFVSALVHCPAGHCGSKVPRGVLHSFLALFSTGDSRAYPFVFQCFSETVGVIAAVSE